MKLPYLCYKLSLSYRELVTYPHIDLQLERKLHTHTHTDILEPEATRNSSMHSCMRTHLHIERLRYLRPTMIAYAVRAILRESEKLDTYGTERNMSSVEVIYEFQVYD